jgi:hypothetical protein
MVQSSQNILGRSVIQKLFQGRVHNIGIQKISQHPEIFLYFPAELHFKQGTEMFGPCFQTPSHSQSI